MVYPLVEFFFKTWTREGIEFAVPTGSPPTAFNNADRLDKIKTSIFSIDKAFAGLNSTHIDRGQNEITEADLLNAIGSQGKLLSNILDDAVI